MNIEIILLIKRYYVSVVIMEDVLAQGAATANNGESLVFILEHII